MFGTPITHIAHILVLRKNHVSGTVLMFQLMQKSPTNAKILISGNRVMRGLGVNVSLLGKHF